MRPLLTFALAPLLALAPLAHAEGAAGAELDETVALRRLAERLAARWGPPGAARVAVHPRALPGDLALDLPLPAELDLLGSLARYAGDDLVSVQVVLDAPQRTLPAFAALQDAFLAGGWRFLVRSETTGFLPAAPVLVARACAPSESAAADGTRAIVDVSLSPLQGGGSDVRLDLTRHEGAVDDGCRASSELEALAGAPLPTLPAPAVGEVGGQLVTRGREDAMAVAVLRGGGDVDGVVEHYAAALAAAGWSSTPGTLRHELGVRSRWSFVDASGLPWIGLLAVEWPIRTGPVMLSFTVVAEPGP